MKKYELLYIIDRDFADDKREELIAKIRTLIEDRKGEVLSLDKWGMKKFAYAINYKTEGFYVLMNLSTENIELVSEINKLMNITDGIVRQLFVRKD